MDRTKRPLLARLCKPELAQVITGILLLCSLGHASAMGKNHPALSAQLVAQGAQLSHNKTTGQTRFIGSQPNKAITVPSTQPSLSAEQNARSIARTYGAMFGINNADTQLTPMKQSTRNDGRSMVRYQQLHNGIPVLGGEVIINMDGQQGLLSMNGEISSIAGITTTTPVITTDQAIDTALKAIAAIHGVDAAGLQASVPQLFIYDPRLLGPHSGPAQLVWRIEVTAKDQPLPIRELVLINALQGRLALHFNQLHTAKNRMTYDADSFNFLPGRFVCNEDQGDACSYGINTEADAAHLYAGDTYDFYKTRNGRDGINGKGGTIISTVNFCPDQIDCPFVNAFWYGTQMIYGHGFVVDDVVAHELTHGVTEQTSNLFYYYQSGAINESFSDVWGEFVDQTNTGGNHTPADRWYMGEDVDPAIIYPDGDNPYRGAIRSMSNPTIFGDPDRMSSPQYYTDADDSGGVHVNSGINNKAVYLMTDETTKTFNGQTIIGIGIDKVAKIYYEVQTSLLTSASDYADLYAAVNQACNNLTGTAGISSDNCLQVRKALDAVEMDQDPTKLNPDAAVCPSGETPVYTFHDDFESGLGKWQFTHTLSNKNWLDWLAFYGAPYATSGIHSLFGEAVDVPSDQRAQISVTVPTDSPAYLRFNHTYDFEYLDSSYFDGGILEYSTDNGIIWNDASALFAGGQDYNGTILLEENVNPLAGKTAFVGLSHGFVSSRYQLDELAGQQVLFRWRVATDANNDTNPYETFGWLLDDVAVYACITNTPPTAPTLVSPADGEVINDIADVSHQWIDATDPDGDVLSHTVLLCRGVDCMPVKPKALVAGLTDSTPALAGLGGFGIILAGLITLGKRRRILTVITLAGALMLSSSCGGGSSSTTITGPPPPPPPSTVYRWLVKADDGKGGITKSRIRSYTVLD